jgi:hypothetical protein
MGVVIVDYFCILNNNKMKDKEKGWIHFVVLTL